MTASPFAQRLPPALAQADNLPALPRVAEEVLRLCRQEETTLDDLAQVLAHDAVLAARILRYASASHAGGAEVLTLQRAALVLGTQTLQHLALSFSLVASVSPEGGGAPSFDARLFWLRSVVRAVAARALARRMGSFGQDEAFLCGLLAEIGQVVLSRCLPVDYEEVLRRAQAEGAWPGLALEQALLGFDSADVAEALLTSWQLPEKFARAVGRAARSEELSPSSPPELTTLANLLGVAGLVTELLSGAPGRGALQRTEELARRHLALSPGDTRAFVAALDLPVRETAALLDLPLPAGWSVRGILDRALAP